jgi:hypothetical protein
VETMTGESNYYSVKGVCPACGARELELRKVERTVFCIARGCPDRDAVQKILNDSEIHHTVRFDSSGFFNAKHPLRERVDAELLDCEVHAAINDWLDEKSFAEHKLLAGTTWRVRHAGEHNLDRNWVFEQLT